MDMTGGDQNVVKLQPRRSRRRVQPWLRDSARKTLFVTLVVTLVAVATAGGLIMFLSHVSDREIVEGLPTR
jgi:hypothetical protein